MIQPAEHLVCRRICLYLIFALYSLFVVLYAVEVPRWNAPDEPAHFNYVRDLAERRELPILQVGDFDQATLSRLTTARFPAEMPIDALRYEGHQPPLYYVLAAPVYRAGAAFGLDGEVLALRLFSGLLGLLVVLLGYAIARRLFAAESWLALAVAGFLAFLPMHLAVNAAISNDPLANLIMAVIVWESIGLLKSPAPSFRAHLRLGFWLALALLTKSTAYVGVGVAAAAILMAARAQGDWRRGVPWVVGVGAVALILSGWWFARNVAVYGLGDPFGLSRHALVATLGGQQLTGNVGLPTLQLMLKTSFNSFWGQFGWMSVLLDERIYNALAGFCVAAFLGLAVAAKTWRRRAQISLEQTTVLGLTLLLVALATLQYNFSSFFQPQGRYLFPALPALAVAFIVGLRALVPKRHAPILLGAVIAALIVLDWAALFRYILPALRT